MLYPTKDLLTMETIDIEVRDMFERYGKLKYFGLYAGNYLAVYEDNRDCVDALKGLHGQVHRGLKFFVWDANETMGMHGQPRPEYAPNTLHGKLVKISEEEQVKMKDVVDFFSRYGRPVMIEELDTNVFTIAYKTDDERIEVMKHINEFRCNEFRAEIITGGKFKGSYALDVEFVSLKNNIEQNNAFK